MSAGLEHQRVEAIVVYGRKASLMHEMNAGTREPVMISHAKSSSSSWLSYMKHMKHMKQHMKTIEQTHTHTHTHICVYIYIHTHTHTHT